MRRLSLSRLERDIVVQLEEAGSEVLTVVLNSLSDSGEWYPARRDVLPSASGGLRRMVEEGVVGLVRSDLPGYPGVEPTAELLDLERWLAWEQNGGYWRSLDSREISLALLRRT